jgi:hypothetical protein
LSTFYVSKRKSVEKHSRLALQPEAPMASHHPTSTRSLAKKISNFA